MTDENNTQDGVRDEEMPETIAHPVAAQVDGLLR